MAKQVIAVGAVPNDGLGDTLRNAMIKSNSNFDELYEVLPADVLKMYNTGGFGYYHQAVGSQVITTTPSKLTIDGSSGLTETSYLPREIRGSAELWDAINNDILPIGVGDTYQVRLDLNVTGKTATPTEITIVLDIGAGAGITIPIYEATMSVAKTPPYALGFCVPIFALGTFNTNKGQLFLSVDAGTITLGNKGVMITRLTNGQL